MGRFQNKKKPAPAKPKTKKAKEPSTFEEFMEGKKEKKRREKERKKNEGLRSNYFF